MDSRVILIKSDKIKNIYSSGGYETFTADKLFDGNASTYWNSLSNDSSGNTFVTIELYRGAALRSFKISGIRPISGSNYGLRDYKIYGSNDNITFIELYSGYHANDALDEIVSLNKYQKYLFYKFESLSSWYGGGKRVIFSEIDYYVVENFDKILLSSSDKIYSLGSPVYATETAIPQMISNTSPSGRAFASSVRSSSEAAWKAFDRTESYYSAENTVEKVGHLGYEFVNPVAIGKYAVRNRANAADTPPKNWTFEGSNDGLSWTILDSRTNQIWRNISEDKDYFIDLNKVNAYKMYRLNWTDNNGSIVTCINELKMYVTSPFILLSLSDQSEKSFINYGVESPVRITQLDGIKSVESNSNTQESGKTFEHTVDLSRRRVDKILLE